jgi:subtilisin family serine protease
MSRGNGHSFRELLDAPLGALCGGTLSGLALRRVDVAVLDTGVDAAHPALRGKIAGAASWSKVADGEIVRSRLRRTANNDPCGHGTGVAGVISAIAPNARIFDYRVLDADCTGFGDVVLAGLRAAIESRAEIINVSVAFAKNRHWAETAKLLEEAYVRGKIVVASKRNFPRPGDLGMPAELPTAISVDAAAFPNPFFLRYFRQSKIEFAALGDNVRTARAGGGWTRLTGTSFAAPVVAGLCALLRGANRDLALFEIKSILKHHALRCAASATREENGPVGNPLEEQPIHRMEDKE